jgi:hypothetical protein
MAGTVKTLLESGKRTAEKRETNLNSNTIVSIKENNNSSNENNST